MDMTIEKQWDVLYQDVLENLIKNGEDRGSRTTNVREILGYEFRLGDPRNRCTRNEERRFNIFRAIGHWLWIISGRSNYEFIRFYNELASEFTSDNIKLHGAYGPRISGLGVYNQIQNISDHIKQNRETRRALIPIFLPAYDLDKRRFADEHSDEIPCPVALHFLPRDDELNMITYMRSQAAYNLLPMDLFTFTMIQEYVACKTSLNLGFYKHYSGSFHVQEDNIPKANSVINNSIQENPQSMPKMTGDAEKELRKVIEFEKLVRNSTILSNETTENIDLLSLRSEIATDERLWELISNMILFWGLFKSNNIDGMKRISDSLHDSVRTFADTSIGLKDEE